MSYLSSPKRLLAIKFDSDHDGSQRRRSEVLRIRVQPSPRRWYRKRNPQARRPRDDDGQRDSCNGQRDVNGHGPRRPTAHLDPPEPRTRFPSFLPPSLHPNFCFAPLPSHLLSYHRTTSTTPAGSPLVSHPHAPQCRLIFARAPSPDVLSPAPSLNLPL